MKKYPVIGPRVLARLALERQRQQELLASGRFPYTCATAGIDHDRKLRICTEELGEVAEAIDLLEAAERCDGTKVAAYRAHLKDEITQLAACAVAWLECLEATR